jgi:hypothetical protein
MVSKESRDMSEANKPAEEFYTVCFKGNPREMAKNLFQIVSPFGEVVAIGIGNEFEASDALREQLKSEAA